MNIPEMIEAVRERVPGIRVTESIPSEKGPDSNWFRIYLANEWMLSCGYEKRHYCENRFIQLASPRDATTVEIAIFTAEGDWYIAEGMVTHTDEEGKITSGVFSYKTGEELVRIAEYVSSMPPKPP